MRVCVCGSRESVCVCVFRHSTAEEAESVCVCVRVCLVRAVRAVLLCSSFHLSCALTVQQKIDPSGATQAPKLNLSARQMPSKPSGNNGLPDIWAFYTLMAFFMVLAQLLILLVGEKQEKLKEGLLMMGCSVSLEDSLSSLSHPRASSRSLPNMHRTLPTGFRGSLCNR